MYAPSKIALQKRIEELETQVGQKRKLMLKKNDLGLTSSLK
jgi:hypothetical protein